MKIKKILSTVISAAMCLSLLSANVSADEFVQQVTFENSVLLSSKTPNVDMSVNNMFSDVYQLENAENTTVLLNGITVEDDGISLYSNSVPVAGLTLIVANPESIVDGKATTDTILYWV